MTPAAVALAAALLAGGVWMIRGIWLFGSPVEVVTDRYYGSILQDLHEVYGNDWFYLLFRLRLRMDQWLGPRFLLGSMALLGMAGECAIMAVRGRADRLIRIRAWFLVLTAAVAAISFVGLLGAPWTSLEFTGGLSLRYALPLWMLLALVAYAALFSRAVRWYEHPRLRWIGWALLSAGAIWLSRNRGSIGTLAVGAEWVPAVVATAAALAVGWSVMRAGAWVRWRDDAPRSATAAILLLVVIGCGARWLDARHAPLATEAEAQETAEINRWLDGKPPAVDPVFRQVFLEVRADELRRGEDCHGRRFFVASRFDAPLTLQPSRFTSVLYESRWETDVALKALRRSAGPHTCDYVVINQADADTRVVARVGVRPVPSSGPFLTYRVVRPETRPGS